MALMYRADFDLVDADLSLILNDLVRQSRAHLANYVTYRTRARNLPANEPIERYRLYQDLAGSHRSTSRTLGHIIRERIARRTADERRLVAASIEAGTVEWVEPGCGGDTCADCERPLWWHIYTRANGMLCPFGRLFWACARALQERDCGSGGHGDEPFLGIVAAGTRR